MTPLQPLQAGQESSVIRDLLAIADRSDVVNLAGGLPAPESLARPLLADAMHAAVREPHRSLQYGPTAGDGELRRLLAQRERCSADELLVTTGSQQGLDLLARCLVRPGDHVVVEDPGYVGARHAFRVAGAELVPVPVDADGIRVDVLAAQMAAGLRPVAIHVVPSFQNPTGVVLSAERRAALLLLAASYDTLIIEDDPYRELWFDRPPPLWPECATERRHRVSLRSTSKVAAPGLRVGWMVGPPELVDKVSRRKQVADLHTSGLGQVVIANLLADEKRWDGHLEWLRALYRDRCFALTGAIEANFGPTSLGLGGSEDVALSGDVNGRVRPSGRGGFFAWVDLTHVLAGTDAWQLLEVCLEAGVALVPGPAFSDAPSAGASVRLSWSTCPPAELVQAVERVASVVG